MKAAIYVRVSTERQASGVEGFDEVNGEKHYSLQTQEDECLTYAREQGWTVEPQHIYRDAASGATDHRPKLTAMREALRNGEFQRIVIYKLDRLARDLDLQSTLFYEAKKRRVEYVSATNDFDNTVTGQILRAVVGAVAEQERRNFAERSQRGARAKIKDGKVLGKGRLPYGYKWKNDDKKSGMYEFHPEEVKTVRLMYDFALEGKSSLMISLELNKRGIPTATGLKSNNWTGASVRRMLENPVYKGEAVHYRWRKELDPITGKYKWFENPESEWLIVPVPALVTAEEWELALMRMTENKQPQWTAFTKDRGMLFEKPQQVICGKCGLSFLRGEDVSRRKRAAGHVAEYRYTVYRHNPLGSQKYGCTRATIRSTQIDDTVWERVKEWVKNPDRLMAALEDDDELEEHLRLDYEAVIGALEDKEKEHQRAKRSFDLFASELEKLDDFDEEDEAEKTRWFMRVRSLRKEVSSLKAKAEVAKERLEQHQGQMVDKVALRETAKQLAPYIDNADIETRRFFVGALGVQVKVYDKKHPVRWEASIDPNQFLVAVDALGKEILPEATSDTLVPVSSETSGCRYFESYWNNYSANSAPMRLFFGPDDDTMTLRPAA